MFAILHAQRLGLRGWVRNLPAGEVEVLVEGPPEAMAEFLELLKRGPAAAEVTSFVVSAETFGPPLTMFGEAPG